MDKKNTSASAVEKYVTEFYNQLSESAVADRVYMETQQLKEQLEKRLVNVTAAAEEDGELEWLISYLSKETIAFIAGFSDQPSTEDLLQIIEAFEQLYEEDARPINVVLTSAIPLSEDQKKRIITAFEKKTEATHLFVKEIVDPSVIGGVRLESDNYYIDNTIGRKLSDMKNHILKN